MMRHNAKRIVLGVVTVLLTQLALDFAIPNFSTDLAVANLQSAAGLLVAFSLGGFVARQHFLIPALACAISIWVVVVAIVVYMAWPIHQSILPVVVGNLSSLGFIIPTAVGGALFGMWSSRWWSKNRASAT